MKRTRNHQSIPKTPESSSSSSSSPSSSSSIRSDSDSSPPKSPVRNFELPKAKLITVEKEVQTSAAHGITVGTQTEPTPEITKDQLRRFLEPVTGDTDQTQKKLVGELRLCQQTLSHIGSLPAIPSSSTDRGTAEKRPEEASPTGRIPTQPAGVTNPAKETPRFKVEGEPVARSVTTSSLSKTLNRVGRRQTIPPVSPKYIRMLEVARNLWAGGSRDNDVKKRRREDVVSRHSPESPLYGPKCPVCHKHPPLSRSISHCHDCAAFMRMIQQSRKDHVDGEGKGSLLSPCEHGEQQTVSCATCRLRMLMALHHQQHPTWEHPLRMALPEENEETQ